MQKVKIGIDEREVILAPTYREHRKLNAKYGLESGIILTGVEYRNFCIDAVWYAIKRGRVFKPFITKRRMINKMTPWDIDRFGAMFDWVYTGRLFTEDELTAKVEETRRKIQEEIRKATEKGLGEYFETEAGAASDNLKKN